MSVCTKEFGGGGGAGGLEKQNNMKLKTKQKLWEWF